jgi:hypothetical protein
VREGRWLENDYKAGGGRGLGRDDLPTSVDILILEISRFLNELTSGPLSKPAGILVYVPNLR